MSAATKAILAINSMEDLKEAISAINCKQRELQRYAANSFSVGNDANTAFPEMAFSIEKVTVSANTRALKAEYTMELAQDLCDMKEEWAITSKDAQEAIKLISEYLTQGGDGFDDDALERVAEALSWADRIRIVANEEELDEEY